MTCRDDLVKIADYSLASPNALEARDLSMVLAMSFTAGRGDDVRERRLCELTPPLLRTCIGEILHADYSRQSKGVWWETIKFTQLPWLGISKVKVATGAPLYACCHN